MKKFGVILIMALLAAASVQASYTVATFANPSSGSSNPLFWVDWTAGIIDGGWNNDGLRLELPYTGGIYDDVWFEMSQVSISNQPIQGYGETGGGTISFYEKNTISNPLLVITFDSGVVLKFVFGSDNATFSGSEIDKIGVPLSEEGFSFSFSGWEDISGGFSATAAFNSSAIPEPATLAIFGIGAMFTLLRRKRI